MRGACEKYFGSKKTGIRCIDPGADTGFKWGGGARFFRNKKFNN